MDFITTKAIQLKSNAAKADICVKPDFLYANVKDLVVRGGAFYGFWKEDHWSTSIDDLIISIDHDTTRSADKIRKEKPGKEVIVSYINEDDSGLRDKLQRYMKRMPDSTARFNTKIMFADDNPVREDYATTKLDYTPASGDTKSFDKLIDVLYEPEEKEKIMWFLGAALTNSMHDIQKFMYLYGAKGTGKGTVIDIFKMLFQEYYAEIDLAKLTSNDPFGTEGVQELPLLVDPDSDISKITRDTNLLKLTAHEPLTVNKKYMATYTVKFEGLLITASNQRYKVGNIDSGINRRAVVVEPSNRKIAYSEYKKLMAQIKFELGAISYKAMQLFEEKGPAYYENVTDVEMMEATDYIFSFVRENYVALGDPTTLKRASELFKLYLEDLGYDTKGYKRRIKNELQRYYKNYDRQKRIDGEKINHVFSGFKYDDVFPDEREPKIEHIPEVVLNSTESKFDDAMQDCLAQYANKYETPKIAWDKCKTTLKDLDTSELHYVRLPDNLIVIDFDLKDSDGNKDRKRNLQEAAKFPSTYAEYSKSGSGVHLHYIYDGDVEKLSKLYKDNVEVKVFTGKQSLRRKLIKCNTKEIVHISEGLPLKKEEPKMYGEVSEMIWTEKKMRHSIKKCLRKEYHNDTRSNIDFIKHIFEEAESNGVDYDLKDMKNDILVFASRSTHQAPYCLKVANHINYSTIKEEKDMQKFQEGVKIYEDAQLVFFDIEVYSNLLIVVWKHYGSKEKTTWFNPTQAQIEWLTQQPLVGFNCRRYDNHILYGKLVGEDNAAMFARSQAIINNEGGFSSGAYELSYADIYEYAAGNHKQSLKKWEIELGILHDEAEFPWGKPLPESDWDRVAEYCGHDVDATEAVFKAIYQDYVGRCILADLSGLSVNSTTQQHAARFLFGDDPRPQDKFVYTDLSKEFPGYKYSYGKSEYRGENPSEGGYIYSEPGVYKNVAEIDIASMHPTSLIELNYFGPYTQRFSDLKQARVYVKHGDFDKAGEMFNGALKPFLTDKDQATSLAFALKIIINIVYGMTSAKFDNKFRHPKNDDNIVAKRGALFMINLKHVVQEAGYDVAHIKTDSIKIPNVDDKIIKIIVDYGKQYGYNFEVEHVFDKFALVNKSVNIGHVEDNPKWGKEANTWEAIGAQYAQPYVFKTLFTKEPLFEKDYAIAKQVKSTIYLRKPNTDATQFVGKVAEVYASLDGYDLVRDNKDGKLSFVTGTKGHLWKLTRDYSGKEDIDMDYYIEVTKDAINNVSKVAKEERDAYEFFGDLPDPYSDMLLPF